MYQYRKWSQAERAAAVAERRQHGYPWHSPPHLNDVGTLRIITATCYNHLPILSSYRRLAWFEDQLLSHLKDQNLYCAAWVVLPNHYHILLKIEDAKKFCRNQGRLHGRTARQFNCEDDSLGRKVWYRCQDRCMRSQAHCYVTLNYIHNNPIKHGYVKKWGDWPYSSFHWYLQRWGRDWLIDLWHRYPIKDYGAKWDDQP